MERRVTGIVYDQEQVNHIFYGEKAKSTFLQWPSNDKLTEELLVDEEQSDQEYDFNSWVRHIDY